MASSDTLSNKATTMSSKKQKIEHLNDTEWLLRRPETFLGPVVPTQVCLRASESGPEAASKGGGATATTTWIQVETSPALIHLVNELTTNALDNSHRDATQHCIRISYASSTQSVVILNDGSAISIARGDGEAAAWQPTLAFSQFKAGSNFDDTEQRYTAGRNGVGAKGANVFGQHFKVEIVNAADKKVFQQEWSSNMSHTPGPRIKASSRKTNHTQVEWTPDYARLGCDASSMPHIVEALAHHASLCAPAHTKVYLNDKVLKLRTPEHFCRALGAHGSLASDAIVDETGRVRFQVCVGMRRGGDGDDGGNGGGEGAPPSSSLTYAFVNSTPCCEGSHAKMILAKVAEAIQADARGKRDAVAKEVTVGSGFVKTHALVVATALIPNPRFTSQTKECLDTPAKEYGWSWKPSEAFCNALGRAGFADRAVEEAKLKADAAAAKATKATRATRAPSIEKYEQALKLGKNKAILFVAEGDSAKSFVVAGLSVIGREYYGCYAIRGKFVNVRDMNKKSIVEHKEARNLMQILGLQFDTTYTAETAAKLPYAHLCVTSDQDNDGSHIAGLLFNFVQVVAPSLLQVKPGFVRRFATALVRVTLPRGESESFSSQVEYDTWREARLASGRPTGTAKFFKGLATSSAAMAKEYFRNLRDNFITMTYSGDEVCGEALDLVFNKKRADDRKAFMVSEACDASRYVDYSQPSVTVERFVTHELLPQYATASVLRAIPSVLDSFKVSHRKVFFGTRALKMVNKNASAKKYEEMTTVKVSVAASKVSSHTMYHHADQSLENTIVGMCIDYAGAPNINLLQPAGSYGNRHLHRAGAPRYIETCLNDPLQMLLYPPADDAVLTYLTDEGVSIEPDTYVPVIPTVLATGARGIAMGYSTECPQYHPVHIVDACLAWNEGDDDPASPSSLPPLKPWYRGFHGRIDDEEGQAHTYLMRGTYEWHGDDLHVTEVPCLKETEGYEEAWRKLCDHLEPGPRKTDERVHTVLKKCSLAKDDPETLKKLGLEKRLTFGNVHLINAAGKLCKYDTPESIVAEHARERLRCYEKRLAHQVTTCEAELSLLTDRARFIDACTAGTFDVKAHADEDAASRVLGELGFAPREHGYDHLLSLPLKSLTVKRAEEVRKQCAKKAEELTRLRGLAPRGVWTTELRALREALLKDERYA